MPARERIRQWPKTSVPDPIEGGIYFDSPKEEEYLNFGSQIDMYLNILTLDNPTEKKETAVRKKRGDKKFYI